MKDQDFELRLLIKQNTEMAIKLQYYRKENRELTLKNSDLNCYVQNLSEVFASISAAWKIITDNQEALYTLMNKKSDPANKKMISKYISHFKAFDEIIINLGDKITNQNHSDGATVDAKTRLTSFVNNYNLFFLQFVDSYFKFNEECASMVTDRLKDNNMHTQMKLIAVQSLENRQRIEDFQEFINKISQNYKTYENQNQYQLLDGLVMQKHQEIDDLKDKNLKQARRIAYMTDYSTDNVSAVLESEDVFQCTCGGSPLQYYKRVWEDAMKDGTGLDRKLSNKMIDEKQQIAKEKIKEFQALEVQKELLIQRNVQMVTKYQKSKQQNRVITDQMVLQSPIYLHLRNQFKDLMDYTNELILKLNKNFDYLNQLQKARYEEIDELKRKTQKSVHSSHRHHSQHVINIDHCYLNKFKESVETHCVQLKNIYNGIHRSMHEKEDNLLQSKDAIKFLKKQNEELNRRLGDLQEKMTKNVDSLEFRHQRFNQLEKNIGQILKNCPKSQENDKTKKTWVELIEYAKTRDKKIRAMEDMIKKKEKEIVQKQKVEEVLKNALSQTESIYQKYKEKLDAFQTFMKRIEKQILNLSEEHYKLKIQSEQEKNMLNIRLKNQLEVKSRLQEKARAHDKLDSELKSTKNMAYSLQKTFNEFQTKNKERINSLRLEIKEKERIIQQLNNAVEDKDKAYEKSIEDKERKNLKIGELHHQLSQKPEQEVLKIELQEYKSKIMCRCGHERQRELFLKTCPHIFCRKCIEEATTHRNRKCPICGIKFGKMDIHEINWG